jgi:insulysin
MPLYVLETVEAGIVKPDVDKAAYRVVRLDNGIKALLISDPLCDKAAAAVDVGVGILVTRHESHLRL